MNKNQFKKTDQLLKAIGQIADEENVTVYAVGGYVRDRIMNRSTQEIDFAVIGDGLSFARESSKRLRGHGLVVYEKFGTASFLLNDMKCEFVGTRKEKYDPDSRNPVVEQSDLEADLTRRDFTVNTLAMAVNTDEFGNIVDLFDGQGDIDKGIIRTPLDPVKTFSDDPLRIMRAARFASQLGFEIEDQTLQAMAKEKERLQIVSQERITDEFLKILSHPKPSIGLRILQETNVMGIIFPEIAALEGVEQRDSYHHKDVFNHTMKVVDNLAELSDDLLLRFTALVHDIGKPRVKRFIEGTGWTFHGHELVGVRMLRKICQRLKLSKEYSKYSQKLTRLHMRPIHLIGEEVTDSAIRRLIVQSGEDLEALMTLCRADITSGNPKRVKKHLANFDNVTERIKIVEEKDRLRAFQSPVRGNEIMKVCEIPPGPLVGQLKNMIEEAILEGQIPNEYDAAYDYLLRIKDSVLNKNE